MRPIKLTLQAFGPFKNKIEIPFENLGTNNLYLISGVTGSGKTSIFDAICYALYNCACTTNRGNNTLKSDFANDNTDSYVELDFIFNNEKYNIIRYPSYERKKTRGEGYIQEQSRAILTLPNGKIIEKVKDVDEYIVNLLGINIAQFSQIALLAQGEFLKLLNTDTQTRGEVFRNIFKTWDYAQFQNKLKEKMLTSKSNYEDIEKSILQYTSNVVCLDENLKILTEKYNQNSCFENLEEFIVLLNKQNKKDLELLSLYQKKVKEIELKISALKSDFQNIQLKQNLINQQNEYSKNLKEIENTFLIISKEYNNRENLKNDIEKLIVEINKSDIAYKNALEIKKLISEKENKEQEEQEIQDKITKQKEVLLNLKHNHLSSINFECEALLNTLKEKQEDFSMYQTQTNELSQKYNNDYNNYLNMQAGIIASTLAPNMPCPVCGSTIHPNIAKTTDKNLTKEYIDELKNQLDFANNELLDKSKECFELKEKYEIKTSELSLLSKKYEIQTNDKAKNSTEINFEIEINSNEKKLENLNDTLGKIQTDISTINTKINTLSNNNILDIEKILEHHGMLNLNLKNIQEKLNKIEKEYNDTNIELNQLTSKIKLIEQQIAQYKNIEISQATAIKEKLDEFESKIIIINKNTEEILARKGINTKTFNEITKKNNEFKQTLQEYTNLKILSDCANGTLKGKARIPFEQYIQAYYLDLVLIEANKRLKIMTQNQFQLLRKKDITSMQSKSGLDLEVMDFHTFKKRSTKTLSGGESFKAALALALGLADCISNISGAINIDSLFIDEGFGSLDNESLELAMDVIFNLSSNNRLIGIISHVEDLKTKIENIITVHKSENGSTIEYNF